MTKKQSKKIMDFYNLRYKESERLSGESNKIEMVRTLDILKRFLPKPPAIILDVGGGTGAYAFPLAKQGYSVHLSDIIPLHIEQAKELEKKSKYPLTSIVIGDARNIKQPDNFADAVLFFGPLYHLTSKEDRIKALKEAYRVLKRNGLIFAVGISSLTSFFDGVKSDFIQDPDFVKIIERDIKTGQHRNPKNHPSYFTTAFFHRPNQLKRELEEANFKEVSLLSIEGPIWLISNWKNQKQVKKILDFLIKIEADQSITGASCHIMAIGEKKVK